MFTHSEKKKISCAIVLLVVSFIMLSADFSAKAVAMTYAIGIVALVVIFEIYIYFTYVSGRFRNFSHAIIYVRGTIGREKTYVDLDGKFAYRYSGELNGATVRFPRGIHTITIRNKTASASVKTDITDSLIIRADIGDSNISYK